MTNTTSLFGGMASSQFHGGMASGHPWHVDVYLVFHFVHYYTVKSNQYSKLATLHITIRRVVLIPCDPKFCVIISPCSVTLNFPLIVLGGWASTALYRAGLPPLPTVPPLPWKKVSSTPYFSATLTIFSWLSYCAQQAAKRPASLAESLYPTYHYKKKTRR